MYGIGNLQLKSVSYESGLVIGKNYPGAYADMEITYISYQDGAFAPLLITSNDSFAGVHQYHISITGNMLTVSNLQRESQLSIFDVMGRPIIQQQVRADAFSTSLNSGIYVVRVNAKSTKVMVF
jgi:hypothetical protein